VKALVIFTKQMIGKNKKADMLHLMQTSHEAVIEKSAVAAGLRNRPMSAMKACVVASW
jgi:hypothetical protein